MKSMLMTLVISACVVTSFSSIGKADEQLDRLKSIYDKELMKIVDANLADIVSLQQSYTKYLDAELNEAQNAGDLKAYEIIDQEKKRFEFERIIPSDSPFQNFVAQAEARLNAAIYDLSIKYNSRLKLHQVSLMKAKDIEGAREVQREIDKVQAAITEHASKLAAMRKPEPKNIGASTSLGRGKLTKPAAITVNWHNTEFLVGNSAYTNYQYLLTEVPKELDGYLCIQQVKRKETAVEFEVTGSGIVYYFHSSGPSDEWEETGWTVGINYNGNVAKLDVYKKALNKGIYNLPKGAWLLFPKK